MDFNLTEEQRLLSETINRFISDRYGFEDRLHAMREGDGFSRKIWAALAETGVLGLSFSEEDGGFGGGGVETMIVMEALGRGLLVEPYLATVVLAGGALRAAGSAKQKASRVVSIVSGELIMALAHHEPAALRHTVTQLNTRAERSENGWSLSGNKISVIAGASADELIVSAITDDGTSLFLVDPRQAGVVIERRDGYDGIALANIAFHNVPLGSDALLGESGSDAAVLTSLFEEANAALCAEAVGIMSDTLDLTVEYLRTRTQFGVPIGSFQALQHRAVDMLMQLELARSMAILAALSLTRPADERRRSISAAKAKIGQAGRFIGQQAIQLHGAIGLTMEYKVGHAFKRLTAIDAMFGDSDHHLDMLTEAGGLISIN